MGNLREVQGLVSKSEVSPDVHGRVPRCLWYDIFIGQSLAAEGPESHPDNPDFPRPNSGLPALGGLEAQRIRWIGERPSELRRGTLLWENTRNTLQPELMHMEKIVGLTFFGLCRRITFI